MWLYSACPACITCQTQDFWQTLLSKSSSFPAYLTLALTVMSCSFLSSLAINVFAVMVPAPNSISTCISQFMLQRSSQFPLKYQHSHSYFFCLLPLTKYLMSNTKTFQSIHSPDFIAKDSTESTLCVELMLSTLKCLKVEFLKFPLATPIFYAQKIPYSIRENPKSSFVLPYRVLVCFSFTWNFNSG